MVVLTPVEPADVVAIEPLTSIAGAPALPVAPLTCPTNGLMIVAPEPCVAPIMLLEMLAPAKLLNPSNPPKPSRRPNMPPDQGRVEPAGADVVGAAVGVEVVVGVEDVVGVVVDMASVVVGTALAEVALAAKVVGTELPTKRDIIPPPPNPPNPPKRPPCILPPANSMPGKANPPGSTGGALTAAAVVVAVVVAVVERS